MPRRVCVLPDSMNKSYSLYVHCLIVVIVQRIARPALKAYQPFPAFRFYSSTPTQTVQAFLSMIPQYCTHYTIPTHLTRSSRKSDSSGARCRAAPIPVLAPSSSPCLIVQAQTHLHAMPRRKHDGQRLEPWLWFRNRLWPQRPFLQRDGPLKDYRRISMMQHPSHHSSWHTYLCSSGSSRNQYTDLAEYLVVQTTVP